LLGSLRPGPLCGGGGLAEARFGWISPSAIIRGHFVSRGAWAALTAFVVPYDFGLGPGILRFVHLDRHLRRVLQLDRSFVERSRVNGRLSSWRLRGCHGLRQGTGRQYEDALSACRTTQGLVAFSALAPDTMAERANYAEVLNPDFRSCAKSFEESSCPAEEIQENTPSGRPPGPPSRPMVAPKGPLNPDPESLEMTLVQIILNSHFEVNGVNARRQRIVLIRSG
jgi:hypothetical protein